MTNRPSAVRSVFVVAAICACAVFVLHGFADPPPPEDPLGDLRARTEGLSDADLNAGYASDPGMAVILAERLARRDLRAEIGRIAELFETADRGLGGSPWLRVEAALLGARLLAFDEARAPGAVAHLRAALEEPSLPSSARAHALFGLGFLVPDAREQLRLFLEVEENHPESAYAPLAAAEATGRAWDLHLRKLIFEIEQGLSAQPDGGREARTLLASRLVDRVREEGVADGFRDLPGKVQHRLSGVQHAGTARGMLIRLSPPRLVEEDGSDEVHDGEQDAPEIVARWTGDAPVALLEDRPPARYLALAVADGGYETQLYEITSTAVEARVGPDGLVLHACDARTGAPRAGARFLGGWSRHGLAGERSIWTPFTVDADADGLVRMPLDPPLSPGEWLDVAARACHPEGGAALNAELYGADRSIDGVRVALFAARPMVRPGDTIDFRLVAREPSTRGAMTVPAGARFSVSLEDGDGEVFHQEVLVVSEFGTATARATVPDSAALGPVSAHVECQEPGRRVRDPQWSEWDGEMKTFSQFLCRIEEYRLPEVTVSVETDRPWYVAPGAARVTVRVEAAEGGPVAGFEGSLRLAARQESWSEPDPLAELPFLLPPTEDDDFDSENEEVSLRIPEAACHFVTDAEGRAVLDLPLRRVRGAELVLVRMEAEGADPQGRNAKGSASFRLVRNPARMRLSLDWDWTAPRIVGRAILVDPLDRPVAAPVCVTVRTWDGQEVARRDLPAGGGALSIEDLPGGSYRVEARAEVAGQVVSASDWAWVQGRGAEMRSEQMTLQGDREVYRPGETLTARAIVPAGVRGVLATLENDRVVAVRFFPVADGAAEIAIPLPPEAAPNVRLVVSTWKDGMYQEGSLDRFVDAVGAPLVVEVLADPATAPPGAETAWTVRVRDSAGQPVDAEVALAVVDARVYALQEDPAPALPRRFASLPKRYRVIHARSEFSVEDLSDESSVGATACFSVEESEEGAMPGYEPVVRKEFHDLAGWFPSLRTGPGGEVTVRVRFSDSLTPWRATARAFAANGATGEARGAARTLLPVTLRLDAPSLLHRGDEVEVGVLVRNHGDVARAGTVSLEIEGLAVADETAPRQVDLPAGGSVVCRWRVTADQDVATARLRAIARLGDAGDAVEKNLPVLSALTRVPITAALRVDGAGRATWKSPEPRDPGYMHLELSAAPEELERLLAPLDELLHYPYGCVEQTMSGFLPAVVVRATLDGLGIRPPSLSLETAAVSQAGVGRLMGFQHEDGGWGWWTGDQTDPFMTAYVVHGLLLAKSHGVLVDDAGLTRGVDCLAELARSPEDPETRAFARWVLVVAGRKPEGAESRPGPGSSAVEIAYTLRAAHRAGDATEVARLGRLLVASADSSEEGKLRWAGNKGFFGMSAVATSVVVEALLEAGIEAPAVQSGLRWLAANRLGAGYGSTIANAFATLACARDLAARGGRFTSTDVRVRVGGKDVPPQAGEPGDPVTRWGFAAPSALELEIQNAGQAPMSLWVRGEDWVSDEHLTTAGSGVEWSRGLWRLLPGGEPERDNAWAEVGEAEPVAVGPVYEIRYRIGCSIEYLAVDDPRPAGMVPVRAVSGFDARSGAYVEWHERETTTFVRHYDSAALVRLPVRFDTPGRVLWPAARAFAMYDESLQAFAPSRVLVVAPEAPPGSSGARVPELAASHAIWEASQEIDERAWSAWRRIALDLTDSERSELRTLARAVRHDREEWSGCGAAVVDGLLRVARADDPRDVDLLLDLDEGDNGSTALANMETWFPFETELARAAVQRRSERAWEILGQILPETREPQAVLDAMEEVGTPLRARSLGEFVGWFVEGFQGDLYWSPWVEPVDGEPQDEERLRALLAEWLELRRAAGAPFGAEAVGVCEWAYGKASERPGNAEWEAFRLAAVEAAADCEDREQLFDRSREWGRGPLHVALARRAVAKGDHELWARLVEEWADHGASPRAAFEALAGAEGRTSDAALDVFVTHWFASDPPGTWGSPDEWRADVNRLVVLVSEWNGARKAEGASPTGARLAAFLWLGDAIARAKADGGTVEPTWQRLREDLRAEFASVDPVAAAGAEAFEDLWPDAVWDDPTLAAWIGERWLELAPGAPDLVLSRLRRESGPSDRDGVIPRVSGLPPGSRAALLGLGLLGDREGARPWIDAFAADPAPEIRARLEACLLTHVDDESWDDVFATRPDVIVGHLADPSACTLAVAARLGLEAALPALREIADRDPGFLVARASSLCRWGSPATHDAVEAALKAVGKDVDDATRMALARALELTGPMRDAAALFEAAGRLRTMEGQDLRRWEEDLKNLGRRGEVELVRSAIADARDPQVALLLALGAARRHDARLQAAWRADLDGEGVRRDLAFLALAHDGSREGAEILVDWLATEAGRQLLVRPDTVGVELPDDGSIHAGFLGEVVAVVVEVESEKNAASALLQSTLPRLPAMLPPAAAWRLISGADPRAFPVLLVRWIECFAPDAETTGTAIPGMVALATRILGPARFVNEPAAAALQFLERQERATVLQRLAQTGDREFVACARLFAGAGDAKDTSRLERLAAGGDPVLARHARAALEWGKTIREWAGPVPLDLSTLPNPFAVPSEAVVVDAIRHRFGEDPFAPLMAR